MRLPHPPPSATRFFARPLSGWLECPKCGKLLYFQSSQGGRQRTNASWDARTSRLACPECGLVLVIGLIAWPVKHGARRTAPRDQVPNERQLAQLRSMGGEGAGWWMPREQAKGAFRPEDTNITAACTCRAGTENTTAQDVNCPIHGEGT